MIIRMFQEAITNIKAAVRSHWEYRKRTFRWAWRETMPHVGLTRPTIIIAILSYSVASAVQLVREGFDKVVESLVGGFLYGTVALTIVGLVVFFLNLIRAPAQMFAEIERQRDNLDKNLRKINDKQKETDHLSSLLSEGINTIWNGPVQNDDELRALDDHWKDWHTRVVAYLTDHFNQADVDHFNRLGVLPKVTRGGTFVGTGENAGTHRRILMHYALQEQRLREIVRDYNINHIYLQYDPIISTMRG